MKIDLQASFDGPDETRRVIRLQAELPDEDRDAVLGLVEDWLAGCGYYTGEGLAVIERIDG